MKLIFCMLHAKAGIGRIRTREFSFSPAKKNCLSEKDRSTPAQSWPYNNYDLS